MKDFAFAKFPTLVLKLKSKEVLIKSAISTLQCEYFSLAIGTKIVLRAVDNSHDSIRDLDI